MIIITVTLTTVKVCRSLVQLLVRPEMEYMKFVQQADRREFRDPLIHEHRFKYMLNNEIVCKGGLSIFLLIYVLSSRGNELTRQAIRQTWGSVEEYGGEHVRVVFLIGQNDDGFDPLLQKESEQYGDVIQGNFLDTYRNLTYKSVMGLHWVTNYCNSTRFLLRTDDDVVVNIYKLVHFLKEIGSGSKSSNFLYCNVEGQGTGVLPIRNQYHKFYVNTTDYKYDLYPPYCHGLGSVFSVDVATKLLEASKRVPFFKFEDVFMGFCAKVAGIEPQNSFFGFYMDIDEEPQSKPFYWTIVKHLDRKPFHWAILKHLHGKPWKIKSKEFKLSRVQNGIFFYRIVLFTMIMTIFGICLMVILFALYLLPRCFKLFCHCLLNQHQR